LSILQIIRTFVEQKHVQTVSLNMNIEEIQHIRADFPILEEKIYNKDLIYFDNGATTQKPRCVVEKIEAGYYHLNANIHRGVHFLSQKATEEHEAARDTVADFLGANKREEIIFTRGTTEAINLVATSFGEAFCKAGDEIVISVMEHHSNIVPWQMLCERKGLKLRVIQMNDKGELDIENFKTLLNDKTRIVSVTHVSNVLGTVNPVAEIIKIAHEQHVPVLVDGAQAVPHIQVNVVEIDADFYVFSGHKIYGPTGIGALYGKEKWLNKMPPYQGGGEMIQTVTFEKTTYNELPFKFEAGTPDYIGSTALAEALRYVQKIGISNIAEHEHDLLVYVTKRLMEIDGMKIIGTASEKSSVISFLVGEIHPYDIGMLLDKLGIAVRTGHHCAQPLIDLLGIPGTVRASFAFYNTKEEIDNFMTALKRVVAMLG
jgi:cysteine desulfurase / selenocysteine lyase